MKSKTSSSVWTIKQFVFGLLGEEFDIFKNLIILLAKRFIYRCKVEGKLLSFYVFKEWIKAIEKSERFIANRNGKIAKHLKKWEAFFS